MSTDTPPLGGSLPAAERALVAALWCEAATRPARPGWRYGSTAELLLDVGRLFTPTVWTGEPGTPGNCYVESVSWATAREGAYVEGAAWGGGYAPHRHAWHCSPGGDLALDSTWAPSGTAYLGLPVEPRTASALMGDQGWWLLAEDRPVGLRWLEHGVPEDLLVDCGRPLPAEGSAW